MQASPGVASATQLTPSQDPPSQPQPKAIPALHELEDLLYDLLHSGHADPNLGHDKFEEIQAFLHEHARERKTHAQFVAFFEAQALPMQPERPSSLVLPRSTSKNPALDVPLALELQEAQAAWRPAAPAAISSSSGTRAPWLWAIGFAIVCILLGLGVVSLMALRDELARLHVQVVHSAQRLEQLQSETSQLRALVDDSNRAVQRTGRDAELLLRTLTAPTPASSK